MICGEGLLNRYQSLLDARSISINKLTVHNFFKLMRLQILKIIKK